MVAGYKLEIIDKTGHGLDHPVGFPEAAIFEGAFRAGEEVGAAPSRRTPTPPPETLGRRQDSEGERRLRILLILGQNRPTCHCPYSLAKKL